MIVDAPPKNSLALISTVSILAGLLGIIGLCFAGGMVFSNYNAAALTAPAADASAVERFEYELQSEWQSITQRYMPGLVTFTFWQLIAMVLLLVGGIRLMRRTESSRQFMLYVLLMVLLYELLRAGMYLAMMLEMMPLVDTSMNRVLKNAGKQTPQMVAVLKRIAQGITVVLILMVLVWPAIKLIFYGWAARYVSSREAMDACQR